MHFTHHLSYRNKLEHFLVDMFEGTAASGPEVCVFAFFELPSYDNPCLEAVLSGNNAWVSFICPNWCVCEVSSFNSTSQIKFSLFRNRTSHIYIIICIVNFFCHKKEKYIESEKCRWCSLEQREGGWRFISWILLFISIHVRLILIGMGYGLQIRGRMNAQRFDSAYFTYGKPTSAPGYEWMYNANKDNYSSNSDLSCL